MRANLEHESPSRPSSASRLAARPRVRPPPPPKGTTRTRSGATLIELDQVIAGGFRRRDQKGHRNAAHLVVSGDTSAGPSEYTSGFRSNARSCTTVRDLPSQPNVMAWAGTKSRSDGPAGGRAAAAPAPHAGHRHHHHVDAQPGAGSRREEQPPKVGRYAGQGSRPRGVDLSSRRHVPGRGIEVDGDRLHQCSISGTRPHATKQCPWV